MSPFKKTYSTTATTYRVREVPKSEYPIPIEIDLFDEHDIIIFEK